MGTSAIVHKIKIVDNENKGNEYPKEQNNGREKIISKQWSKQMHIVFDHCKVLSSVKERSYSGEVIP